MTQLETRIHKVLSDRGFVADVDYEVISDEIRQAFVDILIEELKDITTLKNTASGSGQAYEYAQIIGRETSVKRLLRRI